jgi:conjugal transfer pilus assembly protein TraB
LEVENDVLRRTLDLDHKNQDEIRKQISDLSKQIGSVQRSGGVTFAPGDGKGARTSGMPPLPPPLAPGGASAQPAAFPLPKGGVPAALPAGRPGVTGVQAGGAVDLPQDGIRVLFKTDPATVKKASEKKLWLNTGAIIPVKLLSGMDAPAKTASGAGAGGASQNSPYPVLMVVRDLMKLPNEVMVDARECFILGEGVGELSSERVQIRGTAISCVKQNGEAVDLDLKGFVNGEDGKLGLRGRVVMKEGALLGRTLLAGFVSGISQAFMPYQQGFVIAQSPNQAFNLPPAGPLAMAGAAGGMGQAARFLARHYSMMAASVFPVIEIDAQREVDFIVGTGRELVDYFL